MIHHETMFEHLTKDRILEVIADDYGEDFIERDRIGLGLRITASLRMVINRGVEFFDNYHIKSSDDNSQRTKDMRREMKREWKQSTSKRERREIRSMVSDITHTERKRIAVFQAIHKILATDSSKTSN